MPLRLAAPHGNRGPEQDRGGAGAPSAAAAASSPSESPRRPRARAILLASSLDPAHLMKKMKGVNDTIAPCHDPDSNLNALCASDNRHRADRARAGWRR